MASRDEYWRKGHWLGQNGCTSALVRTDSEREGSEQATTRAARGARGIGGCRRSELRRRVHLVRAGDSILSQPSSLWLNFDFSLGHKMVGITKISSSSSMCDRKEAQKKHENNLHRVRIAFVIICDRICLPFPRGLAVSAFHQVHTGCTAQGDIASTGTIFVTSLSLLLLNKYRVKQAIDIFY